MPISVFLDPKSPGSFGMDYISPQVSLLESMTAPDCWKPDEDDLELDENAICAIANCADELGEPFLSGAKLILGYSTNSKPRCR